MRAFRATPRNRILPLSFTFNSEASLTQTKSFLLVLLKLKNPWRAMNLKYLTDHFKSLNNPENPYKLTLKPIDFPQLEHFKKFCYKKFPCNVPRKNDTLLSATRRNFPKRFRNSTTVVHASSLRLHRCRHHGKTQLCS